MRGASDEAVLAHAIFEKRVLVTFDKDFGELVYRVGLPADSGIIVFRIPTKSPADVAERILKVIDSRDDWAGIFAVVTNDRIGSGFGSFRIDRDGHSGGEAEGPSVDAEEVRGEGKR